jgi:uncharacterized protein with PIN domain
MCFPSLHLEQMYFADQPQYDPLLYLENELQAMPNIRVCPNCNKILQVGEIHVCRLSRSDLVTCNKCGQKYRNRHDHICPTVIK